MARAGPGQDGVQTHVMLDRWSETIAGGFRHTSFDSRPCSALMTETTLSPTMRVDIRLRPMREPDLQHVYRLEKLSQPTPWPMSLFRRQLRGGASCWVLERGRQIIGFGIVDFVADWAHVTNMCVAPEFRRQGLGRRILLHLLGVASQRGYRRTWLEVRVTNRPAILLYTRLGFRTRRIRKGYYRTREGLRDCLVMVRLTGFTVAAR